MFTVERIDGPLDTWALVDGASGSRVEVAAGRGGMVTRFVAHGREVLYLDADTLNDLGRNVRGGIPVLFPIAGKLDGDTYRVGDVAYTLPQHGFARGRPWTVERTDVSDAAAITLALSDDPSTRTVFPFGFRVEITYALSGDSLAIDTSVIATGDTAVPVHLGFHPYFMVPDGDKAGASVRTDATRAWDNRAKRVVPFAGWDLTATEVDLHLLDHGLRTTELTTRRGTLARFAMDPVFDTLVVWTLAGKDFVCVEPWTAPAGALATGVGLHTVQPRWRWRARWSITVPPH